MKGKQESTDPNPPRMKQRTRPHGGRWPACRRSTPGPSTFSSGWHVQPDPAGDENDPGDAEDGGSSHPKPQNSWQYSLEQVHYSPYEAPAWPTAAPASPPQMLLPALDPSSVTSLSCPQQPLGKERPLSSRPLVGIKVSPHPPPPSPPQSPWGKDSSLGRRHPSSVVETPLSPAQFSSVTHLCPTAARQASLSITTSRSLLKLMTITSLMLSNHLILCCPLLFPPSIIHSIRVFSNELVLCLRWPKYWSFSFSTRPSNEYSG